MLKNKNNKKGFIQLLFNPLILLILLIVIIFISPFSPFKLAIFQQIDFAGFTWQDKEEPRDCGQATSFSSSLNREGEYITIQGSASSEGKRFIETDITNIDEVLIIYEGYGSASANCNYGNQGFSLFASVKGSVSGEIISSDGIGTSCNSITSVTKTFQPAIWKLKNNFDGTWSSLQSLGVGDVFIVKDTQKIEGNALLRIGVAIAFGCARGGGANAYLKIYNIIIKENAVAVCKADKYAYDFNNDGKIATDGSECFDLNTIVLNSEEAIKESFDEKLARITAELEAKNAGLTTDIEQLKQQLAEAQTTPQTYDDTALLNKITQLETELKETKSILADVQAKDRNVVNTIEAQEQFKKPNAFVEFINKIIAWIKNLFG